MQLKLGGSDPYGGRAAQPDGVSDDTDGDRTGWALPDCDIRGAAAGPGQRQAHGDGVAQASAGRGSAAARRMALSCVHSPNARTTSSAQPHAVHRDLGADQMADQNLHVQPTEDRPPPVFVTQRAQPVKRTARKARRPPA